MRGYDFLTDSVAFLDEGTLAVSFFEKNHEPALSRREGTPGSAFVFSTVFLNPITGHLSGQRSWGNAGYGNFFLPLANGNFFVQSNGSLAILPTLEQKQSKLTPGHAGETVSDTRVVYTVANSSNKLLLFVYNTKGSSTKWSPRLLKKSSAVDDLLSRPGCKSVTFINNSVLAITGGCSRLILVESGSKIAEIDSPKHRFGGEIKPSRDGRRFRPL